MGTFTFPVFKDKAALIQWLSDEQSMEIVTRWLAEAIRGNKEVYPCDSRRFDNHELLVVVARDRAAQEILHKACESLVLSFQWKAECLRSDSDFFFNLLYTIGVLKVSSLRLFLVELAQKGELKAITNGKRVSFHLVVLRSLASFPQDGETIQIFERDIKVNLFAGLCYRVLWKFDPKNAVKYLELLKRLVETDEMTSTFADSLWQEASGALKLNMERVNWQSAG